MLVSDQRRILKKIRRMILFFMLALIVSGITAFPAETELRMAAHYVSTEPLSLFLKYAYKAMAETNARFPKIAYGFDWLAFAHLVIAALFIGPYRNPVQNRWVIDWGLFACAAILPLAFIAGEIRHIPFWWRLIDSSFGLFGAIPLLFIRYWTRQLDHPFNPPVSPA